MCCRLCLCLAHFHSCPRLAVLFLLLASFASAALSPVSVCLCLLVKQQQQQLLLSHTILHYTFLNNLVNVVLCWCCSFLPISHIIPYLYFFKFLLLSFFFFLSTISRLQGPSMQCLHLHLLHYSKESPEHLLC